MLKPPANILDPPSPKEPREPHWVVGFLTLFLIFAAATFLAWVLKCGLEYTYTLDSHFLYFVFYGLNFFGLTAGAIAESSGHGLIYDLHQTGQIVAFIANTLFYALLIFMWLKHHGDERLKK